MIDLYGRNIDYLRVSITDRCNLHCRYCLPPGLEAAEKDRERYLTKEEILRVCRAAETIGIHKFKLTGGEPLMRPEALEIIRELKALPGTEAVTLTTNGLLLKKALPELQKLSIDGINVSLDTLKPERFSWITGLNRDGRELWSGVLETLKEGAFMGIPMKINCVPIRGFNEDEILDFVELTRELPVDVRFIELMPIGCGKEYTGIPSKEILRRLEQHFGKAIAIPGKVNIETGRLTENFARETSNPADNSGRRTDGPAEYYQFPGFSGRIGFISPISHKFCRECNRVRLTCEGRLKLCLHYDRGLELKPLLRSGALDGLSSA